MSSIVEFLKGLCSKSNKDNGKSGDLAKDRLKLVLLHDRVNTSPDLIENIRKDILEVMSKYGEIDIEEFDINISNSELECNAPTISANIPLKEINRKLV